MKPLPVRERDLEVEELDLAVLDVHRELRELALVLADGDLVAVVPAADRSLAELDPAFRVPVLDACRARCEQREQ